MAGGSAEYGAWAEKRIKSRQGAQFATLILGVLIFIDDYFNALTVGTVMRPVTDKFKVSRAKLAYIIDSTAAPVCIIAPISSWVVTVMSTMGDKFRAEGIGLDPFMSFLKLIPMNLYALLTLAMVAVLCFIDLEFGPMAEHEELAITAGNVHGPKGESAVQVEENITNPKGTIWDLVVPIGGLVIFTVIAMAYTGGYFGGNISFLGAIQETDAATALKIGGFWAIILSLVLFLPRQVLSLKQLPEAAIKGAKSMLPAITILIFAWTIGSIIGELNTGVYLANSLGKTLPPFLYPALVFALAGVIAFATGTSWGTFAIMVPIAIDFALIFDPEITLIMIAAVLAGAVFGDHCSPISDTTILSSTGAQCDHIEHVSTQLPYAVFTAAISFIGYIVAGILITSVGLSSAVSAIISLGVSALLMIIGLRIAHILTLRAKSTVVA
jgi:Na+/H+ antiporter NhaC